MAARSATIDSTCLDHLVMAMVRERADECLINSVHAGRGRANALVKEASIVADRAAIDVQLIAQS